MAASEMRTLRTSEDMTDDKGNLSGSEASEGMDKVPFGAKDERGNVYHTLTPDAWGLAIMSIILDFPRLDNLCDPDFKHKWSTACRFVFAIVLLIFNLGCQVFLLLYVWCYVVRPAVHTIQNNYKEYHQNMFTPDGTFISNNPHEWRGGLSHHALCSSAIARPAFLIPVLLLWTLRMTQELRETARLWRHISHMRTLDLDDMVVENTSVGSYDTFGKYVVKGLTKYVKYALLICIIIPKGVINFALLFFGCRWLTSTASFADLILNSLALEFVIGIDELLFMSCCPEVLADLMKDMRLENEIDNEERDKRDKDYEVSVMKGLKRSLAYFVGSCLWVFLYITFIQSVIPAYRGDIDQACQEYWATVGQLYCPPSKVSGLWGKLEDCFPYGPQPVTTTTVEAAQTSLVANTMTIPPLNVQSTPIPQVIQQVTASPLAAAGPQGV